MDRIDRLKVFLEKKPDDSFLMHALALEYEKIGNIELAESMYRRIIKVGINAEGTYYHLGKLLEKQGKREDAILVYEVGMDKCKKSGDQHALRELQTAYEDLIY